MVEFIAVSHLIRNLFLFCVLILVKLPSPHQSMLVFVLCFKEKKKPSTKFFKLLREEELEKSCLYVQIKYAA